MIRGYFLAGVSRRRPTIDAAFQFPTWSDRTFAVRLLVDTGADRTIIAPPDVVRLQAELDLDLRALPPGPPSIGVGGQTGTRTMQAVLTLGMFSIPLALPLLEPPPERRPVLPIPSLLGRDILSRFALYVEERTNLVLLLEPDEADAVRAHLPL